MIAESPMPTSPNLNCDSVLEHTRGGEDMGGGVGALREVPGDIFGEVRGSGHQVDLLDLDDDSDAIDHNLYGNEFSGSIDMRGEDDRNNEAVKKEAIHRCGDRKALSLSLSLSIPPVHVSKRNYTMPLYHMGGYDGG